jgi:hypothetical protein
VTLFNKLGFEQLTCFNGTRNVNENSIAFFGELPNDGSAYSSAAPRHEANLGCHVSCFFFSHIYARIPAKPRIAGLRTFLMFIHVGMYKGGNAWQRI